MSQDDMNTNSDLHSPVENKMRVIAIASGKGGVGKTNVTANLSVALAMQGQRVSIIDADTSLGNINILLDIKPKFTLEHLLNDEKQLSEILAKGPYGVQIIPAASGITELANLKKYQLQHLTKSLRELERDFDYLMIDTAAGITQQVIQFIQSSQYAVIVITPEPTSLSDAFSMIKTLRDTKFNRPIYIIVNMVKNFALSIEVYKRFQSTVKKYLDIQVSYLGYVPDDDFLKQAVIAQQPVIIHESTAPSSRSFIAIAHAMHRHFTDAGDDYDFVQFWENKAGEETEVAAKPKVKAEMVTEETQQRSKPEPAVDTKPTAAKAEKKPTAGEVIKQLAKYKLTEKQIQVLTQSLINASVKQFKRMPFDINEQVYRAMEINDFDANEINNLINALTSLLDKQTVVETQQEVTQPEAESVSMPEPEPATTNIEKVVPATMSEPDQKPTPALTLPAGFSKLHQGLTSK
ncbi:MAG: MinD/ParA family protein [Gammaproteobacteria bacterium]|nr:MinD/ParA family protein [Gammaproteobacteria bacterium]MDH5778487.1 MinD/ParA family protein [Gammaproteobacteria bacterium]